MIDLKELVKELEGMLQCNCDLDKWEPERNTGHSFVCRIHETALRIHKLDNVKQILKDLKARNKPG